MVSRVDHINISICQRSFGNLVIINEILLRIFTTEWIEFHRFISKTLCWFRIENTQHLRGVLLWNLWNIRYIFIINIRTADSFWDVVISVQYCTCLLCYIILDSNSSTTIDNAVSIRVCHSLESEITFTIFVAAILLVTGFAVVIVVEVTMTELITSISISRHLIAVGNNQLVGICYTAIEESESPYFIIFCCRKWTSQTNITESACFGWKVIIKISRTFTLNRNLIGVYNIKFPKVFGCFRIVGRLWGCVWVALPFTLIEIFVIRKLDITNATIR